MNPSKVKLQPIWRISHESGDLLIPGRPPSGHEGWSLIHPLNRPRSSLRWAGYAVRSQNWATLMIVHVSFSFCACLCDVDIDIDRYVHCITSLRHYFPLPSVFSLRLYHRIGPHLQPLGSCFTGRSRCVTPWRTEGVTGAKPLDMAAISLNSDWILSLGGFPFFSGWPGPHFCLFWGPKHVKEMGEAHNFREESETDIFWGQGAPLVFRTSKQCKLHFWGPPLSPPTFCEFWYLVGGGAGNEASHWISGVRVRADKCPERND